MARNGCHRNGVMVMAIDGKIVSKFADIAATRRQETVKLLQLVKTPLPKRELSAKLFLEKFGNATDGIELVPTN